MTHEIGIRTLLATPLLREGMAIGYILIRRTRSPAVLREANRAP